MSALSLAARLWSHLAWVVDVKSGDARTSRVLAPVVVVLASLGAAACSSPGGQPAVQVAHDFYAAVEAHDGTQACGLLAPQTRHELESTAGKPCPRAVLEESLPHVRGRGHLERFGNQAQVDLVGDTVFLSEFRDGWRIVALMCTPRGAQPYDCQVKGA